MINSEEWVNERKGAKTRLNVFVNVKNECQTSGFGMWRQQKKRRRRSTRLKVDVRKYSETRRRKEGL